MSTTCQYIVQQALSLSTANASLAANSSEMLQRIRGQQRTTFVDCAARSREYLVSAVNLTSNSAAGNRIFDISTVSPPIERSLQLITSTGVTLNLVDPLDLAGELAPRYYPVGLTFNEVNNEWGPAGPVVATLYYVFAPIDIDPSGPLTQLVSLPDQWTDILVGSLAAYLAHKDYQRDPTGQEIARCQSLADSKTSELFTFLDLSAGARAMRIDIPRPTTTPQ